MKLSQKKRRRYSRSIVFIVVHGQTDINIPDFRENKIENSDIVVLMPPIVMQNHTSPDFSNISITT
jgi:hypothetical protein